MSYIRWGEEMPSGNKSRYFVIGGPDGFVCFDNKGRIPYVDVERLFHITPESEIKLKLKNEFENKLGLNGEELEIVCNRLINEMI